MNPLLICIAGASQFTAGAVFAAPSLNVSWAIVLFFLILGMLVTLSPSRRTYEVKRRRGD